MTPVRALLHIVALALLACTLAANGQAQPYEAPGSARVQVQDLRWTDASRQRALPLRLRLPEVEARVPLVLFSHGLGGSVQAGTAWAEHWASHGIAVLHLQHPGSDTGVWQEARQPARELRKAANGEQLIQRAADVKFVLDELARRQGSTDPADAWTRRIDLTRIGMSGHSFGAGTSQALAGQRYGRHGAALQDERPRAFIAFSPSSRNDDPATFSGITRPFLSVTGSEDGQLPMGLGVPAEQRRAPFERMAPGGKHLLWLTGADHMIFGGQPRRGRSAGTADPALDALHVRLTKAITLAFWRIELMDDAAARYWLQASAPAYVGSAGEFLSR